MPVSSLIHNEKRTLLGLSLFTLVVRIPLAFRPIRELTMLPYGDDAYYLFSTAKNIARGLGPTVDGHQLTNGFQPLITLLYVPLFWLSGNDQWMAVRLSFLLNATIAAATVWLAAAAARNLAGLDDTRRNRTAIFAALLWSISYQLFAQTTNGLETGLYSLLLLAVIALYCKARNDTSPSLRPWVWLGILLGLCVLARIDAAILVAVIFAIELARRNWRGAIISAFLALLVSLPWWIYNLAYFGSLMPTSGQAENIWPMPAGENLRRALQALTDIFPIVFYAPDSLGAFLRFALAIVFTVITVIVFRSKALREHLGSSHLSSLLPFFLFGVAIAIYYTFFFRAPHFIPRYFQPIRVTWLVFVAIVAPPWYDSLANKAWVRPAAIILLSVVLVFDVNRYALNFSQSDRASFYDAGIFANQHSSDKIGMLQSGIASFVAPNVINLDGKVNTDALRAHQEGRLGAYLRDENFSDIADLKPFIEDVAQLAGKDSVYFDSCAMIGDIQIMKRQNLP